MEAWPGMKVHDAGMASFGLENPMHTQITIRALVIGIDDFQSPECPALKKAVNDATGFAKLLSRFGGPEQKIQPLLGPEATWSAVNHAIEALKAVPRESREKESLVVFVATHAIRLRSDSPSYILWHDSACSDGQFLRATRQQHLIDSIKELDFRQKLLILDACHTGDDKSWPWLEPLPDFAAIKLSSYLEKPVMQVIAAAGAREEAFEQEAGPHGTLTWYLLDELQSFLEVGHGVLPASRLANAVRARITFSAVPSSFQNPHFWREEGDGDFLFVHPQGIVPEFDTPRTREQDQITRAHSLERDARLYIRHEDYETAEALLAQAMTQDPSNQRLQEIYEDTRLTILKKKESDECRQHMEDLASEARLALTKKELQKARDCIQEALGYAAKYSVEVPAHVRTLALDLDRETRREAERERKEAERERKQELDGLLLASDRHEQREDWTAALGAIEDALLLATGETQWEFLLRNKKIVLEGKLQAHIDRELGRKLAEMEALVGAGDWENAEQLLQTARKLSPGSPIVRRFIERFALWKEASGCVAEAVSAQQQGAFAQALELWNKVLLIAPDYPQMGIHRAACKSKLPRPSPVIAISRRDGLEYVFVPAGEFLMGAVPQDLHATKAEKPRHLARIAKPFWISRTPVTNAAFKRFNISRRIFESLLNPKLPARSIQFDEAEEYCRFAGGRLPTEAEWEMAARSGMESIYPWGDEADAKTRACFMGKSPCAVQQFPENPAGLFDVAGNVWEWCSDRFRSNYEAGRLKNPPSMQYVVRGGSFMSGILDLRISSRQGRSPNVCHQDVGFRCVRDDPME
jgi:formylglycine-generating enzyme required for sulfatase activity